MNRIIKKTRNFTTAHLCVFDKIHLKFKDYLKDPVNTNIKYPNFFQPIYTAGDLDQIYENINIDFSTLKTNKENKKSFFPIVYNKKTFDKTLDYIFNEIGSGILVYIKNGNLEVFLPFLNNNYKNKWGKYIDKSVIDSEIKLFFNMIKDEKFKVKVLKDPTRWFGDICFVYHKYLKNEPLKDMITGYNVFHNITYITIAELCLKRKVKDSLFFINNLESPLLHKKELYPFLYHRVKLNYNFKEGIIPIYSESKHYEFADRPFFDVDDMFRFFTNIRDTGSKDPETNWEKKKSIALFRGSINGCGYNTLSNKRLLLMKVSEEYNKFNPHIPIDFKISAGFYHIYFDQVYKKWGYANTNIKEKFRFKDKDFMDNYEQSLYKYVFIIEGSVEAFRLGIQMSYGSLLLKVYTPWKIWFSDMLLGLYDVKDYDPKKEYHFVNINPDYSNLEEVLDWCHMNDEKCKKIGQNALKFYKKYLEKPDYALKFLQNDINNI